MTSILMLDEEQERGIAHVRREDETVVETVDPDAIEALCATHHEPHAIVVHDLATATTSDMPWLSLCQQLTPDLHALLYVPILGGIEGKCLGFLYVGSPQPGEFGSGDHRSLEILANQAAIAIQNARYLETTRAYQEQQVETERIAAMADVAGNMVHRINNAVGAIRPLVQQIEMKLDRRTLEEAYLREKLQAIRKSADHTLEVARKIQLPFQSVRLEPIDVNVSIATAAADLRPPAGVEVDIEYGEDLPPVMATHQLDEVFRNLMKNALDAMSEAGGTLTVGTRRANDRHIEVVVRDTGPGIPADIRGQIFHMGTTTKVGSSGFGLWWSRTFLRRLGGDMMLESSGPKGCVFRVTLPVN
jgi:signal transduction histidine kinase